jgi:hypothetical protein
VTGALAVFRDVDRPLLNNEGVIRRDSQGVYIVACRSSTSVPNIVGDYTAGRSSPTQYLNRAAFDYPRNAVGVPIHIQGDAGRNQIEIPGVANWDASLFKNNRIGERFNAQLRFEAFNIFNRTSFGTPNLSWTSPTFGQITSTLTDPRRLQFRFTADVLIRPSKLQVRLNDLESTRNHIV